MSELSGQVTHLEWSATPLWLIPLLPFVGAATNAIFGRRLQKSDAGRDLSKRCTSGASASRRSPSGAMLVAFALVVANFVRLLGLEPGQPLPLLARLADGPHRIPRRELLVRDGSALGADGADHHRRRLAHPHLRLLVHGDGAGLLALLHVPEPLRLLDVAPRPRGQLRRHVLRLGGRRPLQLPAHRLLVQGLQEGDRGHEGLRGQPRRRLGRHLRPRPPLLGPGRRVDRARAATTPTSARASSPSRPSPTPTPRRKRPRSTPKGLPTPKLPSPSSGEQPARRGQGVQGAHGARAGDDKAKPGTMAGRLGQRRPRADDAAQARREHGPQAGARAARPTRAS